MPQIRQAVHFHTVAEISRSGDAGHAGKNSAHPAEAVVVHRSIKIVKTSESLNKASIFGVAPRCVSFK